MLDVWPENWRAWKVWLALQNAWLLVAGRERLAYQGLDPTRVESTMNLMGINRKRRRAVFERLRVMEEAALPVLNEG